MRTIFDKERIMKSFESNRQCRNCNNRPRHWDRMEAAVNNVWHEGPCAATGRIIRPEGFCRCWEMKEEEMNIGDE
jgi:hypothetical protein